MAGFLFWGAVSPDAANGSRNRAGGTSQGMTQLLKDTFTTGDARIAHVTPRNGVGFRSDIVSAMRYSSDGGDPGSNHRLCGGGRGQAPTRVDERPFANS